MDRTKYTSITIHLDTKELMNQFKLVHSESMNSLIVRLLKHYNKSKSKPITLNFKEDA